MSYWPGENKAIGIDLDTLIKEWRELKGENERLKLENQTLRTEYAVLEGMCSEALAEK